MLPSGDLAIICQTNIILGHRYYAKGWLFNLVNKSEPWMNPANSRKILEHCLHGFHPEASYANTLTLYVQASHEYGNLDFTNKIASFQPFKLYERWDAISHLSPFPHVSDMVFIPVGVMEQDRFHARCKMLASKLSRVDTVTICSFASSRSASLLILLHRRSRASLVFSHKA